MDDSLHSFKLTLWGENAEKNFDAGDVIVLKNLKVGFYNE